MNTNRKLRAMLLGSGAVLALASGPALAGQTDNLRTQIDQLQARLGEMEKQQAATDAKVSAAPTDAVVGGDFPGSFKLPGSDTSFAIHGYTKVDVLYDVDQSLGDSVAFTSITPNGSTAQRRDGFFRIHARQSRFNLQTRTPTNYGELKTYIEGDFFGGSVGATQTASNSDKLRLRHAYGVLGPVLGGQTWTNFMDVEDTPETLDFAGPVAIAFVRQGQVRYTQSFGKFTASGSIENPNGDFTTNTGVTSSGGIPNTIADPANKIDRMPDITAKLVYADSWGRLSASGIIRRLEVDNGGGGSTGLPSRTADATGGGGLLGGTIHMKSVLSGASMLQDDDLGFEGFYGTGLGRYIAIGGSAGLAAVVKNFGTNAVSIETQPTWGGVIWYQHHWTSQLRSTAAYAIQRNHISDAIPQTTGLTDRLQSVHANLIWSPVKSVNIGLEFIYGERDIRKNPVTGLQQTGDAKRVQASFQYLF